MERQRQRSGVVTCVARWFAMHAACTLNCTVSIDRTRCVVTQSTHADVVQRATSPTEEVSLLTVQRWIQLFIVNQLITESKNQESPEQDANGGAKSDLTALQNHNLLIALAHGGTSGAAQFAMPVS